MAAPSVDNSRAFSALSASVAFELSQEQKEQFERDGCLVLKQFASPEDMRGLLKRTKEMLQELDLKDHPMTAFTTEDKKHVGDDYFLTSGWVFQASCEA